MARRLEERQTRLLERGEIEIHYRPRAEASSPERLGEVQRLLIVLCPEGRKRYRVVAGGRNEPSDRFWGFVDLVLDSPQDLSAALAAQTFVTRTLGVGHLPAARLVAKGTYTLSWRNGQAHLQWHFKSVRDLSLQDGSAIVTVANPDNTVWGLADMPPLQFELFDDAEVHVTIPTQFPPELQAQI